MNENVLRFSTYTRKAQSTQGGKVH